MKKDQNAGNTSHPNIAIPAFLMADSIIHQDLIRHDDPIGISDMKRPGLFIYTQKTPITESFAY
jgi:hypothetical protein